ncbi:MAG TPA: hypothetical protein VLS89_15945 [Candidatus Nanopelagicales bacterium]|nr:hypothetical protein [Candidatus Nanopelagicales bacterium]
MPRGSSPSRFRRATLALAACAAVAGAPAPAAAQQAPSSATALIQKGSELFEDQRYEESIQTLSAALLRPGLTKQERVEVYRLLAYNYIILQRVEEADSAVRGLLVLDEAFSLPPTESPRFRDVFEATRTKWEEEGKPGKVDEAVPPPPLKPVRIFHSSPAQVGANTAIKLSGTLGDEDNRVKGVQLAYRTGTKGRFVTVPATYTLGKFRAQIPAMAVRPPLVEYYLQAVDQGGLPIASRGDAAAPLRVAVAAPKEERSVLTSPWLWVPVGVAVVGSIVATTLIVSSSSNSSTVSIRVTE